MIIEILIWGIMNEPIKLKHYANMFKPTVHSHEKYRRSDKTYYLCIGPEEEMFYGFSED